MDIPGVRRGWRWVVVAVAMAGLASLPSLVGALPVVAQPPTADPRDALDRMLAAAGTPHEGLAEVRGTLGLPDVEQLRDATALLGGTTRARVWWAGTDRWRVAQLRPAGERDTYRVGDRTISYDYERNGGRLVAAEATVRLPRVDDLLPPSAAAWLLRDVDVDARATALPGRRVGGVAAYGVRIDPVDYRTSIASVRVWADSATSLPVRVEVWGKGRTRAAFVSEFLSVRVQPPSASDLALRIPDDADMHAEEDEDYITRLDRNARWALPEKIAGVSRSQDVVRSRGAGAYGSGSVRFVVVPAGQGSLSRVIEGADGAPGTRTMRLRRADVLRVQTPLLQAAVVAARDGHAYLIAGTVTDSMLTRVVAELLRQPPGPR